MIPGEAVLKGANEHLVLIVMIVYSFLRMKNVYYFILVRIGAWGGGSTFRQKWGINWYTMTLECLC